MPFLGTPEPLYLSFFPKAEFNLYYIVVGIVKTIDTIFVFDCEIPTIRKHIFLQVIYFDPKILKVSDARLMGKPY